MKWAGRFFEENRDKVYPFDVDEMIQLIKVISGGRDSRLFELHNKVSPLKGGVVKVSQR